MLLTASSVPARLQEPFTILPLEAICETIARNIDQLTKAAGVHQPLEWRPCPPAAPPRQRCAPTAASPAGPQASMQGSSSAGPDGSSRVKKWLGKLSIGADNIGRGSSTAGDSPSRRDSADSFIKAGWWRGRGDSPCPSTPGSAAREGGLGGKIDIKVDAGGGTQEADADGRHSDDTGGDGAAGSSAGAGPGEPAAAPAGTGSGAVAAAGQLLPSGLHARYTRSTGSFRSSMNVSRFSSGLLDGLCSGAAAITSQGSGACPEGALERNSCGSLLRRASSASAAGSAAGSNAGEEKHD
jgi:hypothetical protein